MKVIKIVATMQMSQS